MKPNHKLLVANVECIKAIL